MSPAFFVNQKLSARFPRDEGSPAHFATRRRSYLYLFLCFFSLLPRVEESPWRD